MVIAALVAVATAKPGFLLAGVEQTIESHGNSVVHSSAPVVHSTVYSAPAPAPLVYAAAPQPIIAQKTVSSYGHSFVHHDAPAAYFAPSYYV